MGSTSMGAQGIGFGVSLGSTWHDEDCVRRKDARELHNMGHKVAAIALMCQNDNVREAMENAGEVCPEAKKKKHEAEAVAYRSESSEVNSVLRDQDSEYPSGKGR